jgi:hypothetical protein
VVVLVRNPTNEFLNMIKFHRPKSDVEFFIKVASQNKNRNCRIEALKRLLGDDYSLFRVFYQSKYNSIKETCIKFIVSQDYLIHIANDKKLDPKFRFEAAIDTKDQDCLRYALEQLVISLKGKYFHSERAKYVLGLILPKITIQDTLIKAIELCDEIGSVKCKVETEIVIGARLEELPNTIAFILEE